MRNGRRTWAALLGLALLVVSTGCATGSAGFRMGREPQGAAQIAYVQRLVALKGEGGAVAALIAAGMDAREAQKAVLDAVVAAGGAK
jgi:hypothetical protein